jgi:hypothetical protein
MSTTTTSVTTITIIDNAVLVVVSNWKCFKADTEKKIRIHENNVMRVEHASVPDITHGHHKSEQQRSNAKQMNRSDYPALNFRVLRLMKIWLFIQ